VNASTKCPHPSIACDVNITAMTDSNVRCLQLTVKCPVCDGTFLFLGAPMGVSLGRPTMSVDRSMLYIPMVPEGEEPPANLPEMIARRVV
jgi:hypothetical protein